MSTSLNAKIPFQPGLALGSVVRGDIIEKMEKYGQIQGKIERVQKELNILEQQAKAIDTKIEVIQQRTPPVGKATLTPAEKLDACLMNVYQKQRSAILTQIDQIPKQIENILEENQELPIFSNISTAVESPFDFDKTTVDTEKRGFDTVTFSSQYVDTSESSQRTEDKMNQSSNASSANVGVSYGAFSANVSHSWSSAATNRVSQIKNTGYASKILVINALVTTRNVRLLKNRAYDPIKLKSILNAMKSYKLSDQNSVDNAERNRQIEALNNLGINVINNNKQIYLLTEAVMGGSFSAIVTYLKQDKSNRDTEDKANTSSSSTDASASAKFWGIGVNGGYSNSNQKADESHSDSVHNRNDLNVSIEFIAQGIIPQFARETVVREVLKQQEQNVRKYESMGSDKTGKSASDRQVELQSAMYKSLNGLSNVVTQKEEVSINTPNTIMTAYDDFCGEITNDTFGGVPIGFNYAILTEKDIEQLLEAAKDKHAPLETEVVDSTASHSSSKKPSSKTNASNDQKTESK
ncbi:hypothetical protein [Rhabdochlamydiaceae symbiont of Dictyostelium giganteum]|uniref:hypothetical protein n=1 Tax=Rhabdochlamydiaceae symbiont of Dictyostelium giganteum TaxID=3342349 RepID=UPI00384D3604